MHFLKAAWAERASIAQHTARSGSPRTSSERCRSRSRPCSEQKRIAAILDKADAIQRKRQEAIRLTEELLRSAFLEMFGDPVTNPKGWERSTFGDETTLLQYGPRFHNQEYSSKGTRIVRITDLDDKGDLNFSAMPRLEVTDEDVHRYRLIPGDVIFARTGSVGKCAVIRGGEGEAIRLQFSPPRVLPISSSCAGA